MNQIKIEDSKPHLTDESFLDSLYSHPGALSGEYSGENEQGMSGGFPSWSFDDTLQAKVDSLISYCFPNPTSPGVTPVNPITELVRGLLTVDGVKHLAEHYNNEYVK